MTVDRRYNLVSKRGASTKGYFKRTDTGEVFTFQFNPNTIKTSRGTNYNELSGCGSAYPNYQYVGGEGEEISFTLEIFSNWKCCTDAMKYMNGLMPPKDTQAIFTKPPVFYFSFGSSFTEKCILTKFDKSHEEFDSLLATTSMSIDIKLKVVK